MNKLNWDNVRFVLAVANTGSVNAAATLLGVTHATVLRRVAAFEDRFGHRIFKRSATGYQLLPGYQSMLEAVRGVEDAMLAVERALIGSERSLGGHVRITSTDSLCQMILPGIVARIAELHPQLNVSLLSSNSHLDLSRLAADITVRPAAELQEGLVGDMAGRLQFRAYGTGAVRQDWLGLNGSLARSRPAIWMKQNIAPEHIRQGSDSFLVLRELAGGGLGNVLLPGFVGDSDHRLRRMADLAPEMAVDIWVASPEELAGNARFRVVREILTEQLTQMLAG